MHVDNWPKSQNVDVETCFRAIPPMCGTWLTEAFLCSLRIIVADLVVNAAAILRLPSCDARSMWLLSCDGFREALRVSFMTGLGESCSGGAMLVLKSCVDESSCVTCPCCVPTPLLLVCCLVANFELFTCHLRLFLSAV